MIEKLTEPFEQVEGNITIEGVDFDCTCVMLQSKWGNYGKFNGEKLELERFVPALCCRANGETMENSTVRN